MGNDNLIEIKFDEKKLRQLEIMFRGIPDEIPGIIFRAINKTIAPAKTEVSKGIRQEINIKAADVKDKIIVEKASTNRLMGTISLSHRLIPIMDFGAKETAKGVSFKVYKSGGRKLMKHAFIASMPNPKNPENRHEGVFRKGLGQHKTIRWEKREKFGKSSSPVNWHNVFIGEQYGPSLHQAFEKSKDLIQRVTANAYERLEHNIDGQIQYIFSRIKTGAAAA
jgi:hypothetical protein